jgi:hypothetical protein
MSRSITATLTTVRNKSKRPPETDTRPDQWNRAARFIWRVFIISTALVVSLLLKSWAVPEMTALVAERIPDFVDETVQFLTKIE